VIYSQSRIKRWAREVAESHMNEMLREVDFGAVKFKTEIKFGAPAQKVCRYGAKEGADLIVTATHGRTGISHALIGSTAERIIRYARSPVLVVPSR
jgi:nucleotide-binding universal stress UspA family protein